MSNNSSIKVIGFGFNLLLSLMFFSGCASTGFLMAKPKVTYFGEKYPAKEETSKIDVYFTNKPTQQYIEFAKITCKDTNDKWSLEQVTKKAREIGADGIIMIGKAGSSGVGMPMGNTTYVVSEDYGMFAIAIKYK
jgi:hypothetical protein